MLRAATDLLLLCVAVVIALGGPSAAFHVSSVTAPLLAIPPIALVALYVRGLYRARMRTLVLDGLLPVVSAVSVAAMAAATIGLLVNGSMPRSSDWVRTWLLALVAVGAGRTTLALVQRRARLRGTIGKPVLIVGAGIVGAQVARRLLRHTEYGLLPAGFLDDEPRSVSEVGGRDVPVLGTIEDLERVAAHTGARHLIVAFSAVADVRLLRLIQRAQEIGMEVSVVPRLFDTMNHRASYETIGGLPLLTFSLVDPRGWQFAVKYAIDRVVAGSVLLILSPLIGAIAVAVKLATGGPVLFRQPRVGLDGHEFDMLKFRTMRGSPEASGESDAEWADRIVSANGFDLAEHGTAPAVDGGSGSAAGGVDEDRRTRLGVFLRRTSLDELPQLWNVFNGDMSLIGPRPERASYVRRFAPVVRRYGDRHRVKSGITGWAQVHGLRGQTSLAERVEMDNYYISHWSLALDLKTVLLTVLALIRSPE